MYLIRLDDACPYSDREQWEKVEKILDKYNIKPIVAIIPDCQDKMFTDKYEYDATFWDKALKWQEKGWTIALHGYNHVYTNMKAKGLNPINTFSEFVGLSLDEQCNKIKSGVKLLEEHGLNPVCFVAPAHSFDINTVLALIKESNIRIISDTIANDVYYKYGMFFIPQQCGSFKKLKMKTVTFCYHPNIMSDNDFSNLDIAIKENLSLFASVNELNLTERKYSLYDCILRFTYMNRHWLRNMKKQAQNDER